MSFVNQDDVLLVFENLIKNIFKICIGVELDNFPRISYWEAIENYGSDKPDTRFDMKIFDCTESSTGKGFKILDDSEYVCGITVNSAEPLSRKQIDQYTDWVKQPQIGAKGLIWIKHNSDGSFKSSIDKFYNHDDLLKIVGNISENSTTFLISGNKMKSLTQLGQLRLKIADDLKLIDPKKFCPLWVNDFPLFDWDEDDKKYHSIHHPFTSPKDKNIHEIKEASNVVADAYDLVINGNEIGGGSIRIHNRDLQNQIFSILGFSEKEAKEQFGFLMNAFEYGAPPHGGIALGLDRLVAVMNGDNSIRDFIAFPKNNSGRDVMIDSPSPIDNNQLDELNIKLK
jgi:aspartyl-tRNA synthetase